MNELFNLFILGTIYQIRKEICIMTKKYLQNGSLNPIWVREQSELRKQRLARESELRAQRIAKEFLEQELEICNRYELELFQAKLDILRNSMPQIKNNKDMLAIMSWLEGQRIG